MDGFDDLVAREQRFSAALDNLVERLKQDRYVLAAVLVGSINPQTIWHRDALNLWIIETDGVTRRLASDGADERIFRTLVEDDINFNVELITRTRFKRMVEGASRTAFNHSYFAKRQLLFTNDESLKRWFESANIPAGKDRREDLLTATTLVIHAHRSAQKLLRVKEDPQLAGETLMWAVHEMSQVEIILAGEVFEGLVIYRAMSLNPELQSLYQGLIGPKTPAAVAAHLKTVDDWLQTRGRPFLQPVLDYLKKQGLPVPLSQLAEHHAHSRLYPWHLKSACEWLVRQGLAEKLSASFQLTKKSRTAVEEPAYIIVD